MGISYYAIDHHHKKFFSAPSGFSDGLDGIYHPKNPFPHMLVMMNLKGYSFDLENDCGYEIPPAPGYEDITESLYEEYLAKFQTIEV